MLKRRGTRGLEPHTQHRKCVEERIEQGFGENDGNLAKVLHGQVHEKEVHACVQMMIQGHCCNDEKVPCYSCQVKCQGHQEVKDMEFLSL